MIEWTIPVSELIIDGIIVSAIWQTLSHFSSKKQKKHLEEQLDNLYNRVVEARDKTKE